MKKHPVNERGVALILTLAFLVMLTVVVVGLMESMRIDRPAASSYLERARAGQYAQDGVEKVIATLGQNTADVERNWISQPGQLVVGAAADTGGAGADQRKVLQTVVPLSSGLPTTTPADPVLRAPNLNLPTLRDPDSYLISSGTAALPMSVKWVYVRKDGALDPAEEPDLSNKTNPIVGRYAYWTDDESSKVNYNFAWGRNAANTNPPGHPTKVDLTALPGLTASMADTIHNFITTDVNYATLANGFFNSPADARRVSPAVAQVLENNKFELTHYSHDPDTTFFNEPRFVLTTKKSVAGDRPFFDIYGNDTDDRSRTKVGLDVAKLNVVLKRLVGTYTDANGVSREGYLKRTDWPMVSGAGSSYQQKYFGSDAGRLTQLALNIIDYVRSKEAAVTEKSDGLVAPLRGTYDAGGNFVFSEVADATAYMGVARSPSITEIGIWVSKTPVKDSDGADTDRYPAKVKVEVHLPANYGLDQIDMAKRSLTVVVTKSLQPAEYVSEKRIAAAELSSPILSKGGYVVITRDIELKLTGDRPTSILFRLALALLQEGTDRLDVVPLINSESQFINCPIDGPDVAVTDITSVEIDDPRVGRHKDDWVPRAGGGNTFGAVNSISTLGQSPTAAAGEQQDTDGSGKVSAASLYMPPPAGSSFTRADGTVDNNQAGRVTSAGELGFVHTGVQSTQKGTPWRTLRLQPSAQPATVVPDWALMDLFTPPVEVHQNAKYVYTPHDSAVGGRINVNAKPEPFGMQRTLPLAAVLLNAPNNSINFNSKVTAAEAATIAGNIYNRTLASAGTIPAGKNQGYETGYDTPGEIVEVKGIADSGEQSEELVRQISNLITARGNVFSVYTVGQALKQTPNSKLTVVGEQRLHAMVERYLDSDKRVRFAPVYYRNLTP